MKKKMKQPKLGVYGDKDRLFQEQVTFEHSSLSWKIAAIWKYLGPASSENINDVGDPVFLETPDRAYQNKPILVNIDYEQQEENIASLNQFNMINPFENQVTFRIHTKCREYLGRYPVEGDILQIFLYPDSVEYQTWLESSQDPSARPQAFLRENDREAWLEVIDVDYSQEVENFYLVLTTQRVEDSRKSYEIPNEDESNQPILDNVEDKLKQEQEEDVSKEGLDDSELGSEYENPSEDESGKREDYQPRSDHFLDQI